MNALALSYPKPQLTPIAGKPTAMALRTLRRELYDNARAVTLLANGEDGYLGLIMPATEYFARNETAFVIPPVPGNPPEQGKSGVALMFAQQAYNNCKAAYAVYKQVGTDLKRQILDAIDEEYVEEL